MEVFNKMILMNYFATLNPVAFTNALPGNIARSDMGHHGTRCLHHLQTAGLRRSDG